jgi:hypothetical protein
MGAAACGNGTSVSGFDYCHDAGKNHVETRTDSQDSRIIASSRWELRNSL